MKPTKSTGIIRRVDDLRRLVIPKEICRKHRITEGTPIEFFEEGDSIILRKYSPNGELISTLNWVLEELDDQIRDEYTSKAKKDALCQIRKSI